jgi:hypothetical protein
MRTLIFGVIAVTAGLLQGAAPAPAFERAPDALERVTWRTRTLVGDDRLTKWKFVVPASGVGVPTFLEAVVRADAAGVDFVEGSGTQKVSPQFRKNLDYNLTSEERAVVRAQMGSIRMLTYRVEALSSGSERRIFEFAQSMGVDTIVMRMSVASPHFDALAGEFGVKVAFLGGMAQEVAHRSNSLGLGADTGLWAQEGLLPRDALAGVKDRLMYVLLRDRSGRGATPATSCSARGQVT